MHLCRTTCLIKNHRVIRTPELRVLSPKLVLLKDWRENHLVQLVVDFTWVSAEMAREVVSDVVSWATIRMIVQLGAIELSLRLQHHQLRLIRRPLLQAQAEKQTACMRW